MGGSASPTAAVSGLAKFLHAVVALVVVCAVLFAAYSVLEYGLAGSIAWVIDQVVQLVGDVSRESEVIPDGPTS